jgi:hypothetical protein
MCITTPADRPAASHDLRVIRPRFILTTAKPASFECSTPYGTTRDGSRRYETSRRAVDVVAFGLCGTTPATRSAAKSRTMCTAPFSAPLVLQTPESAESRCSRTGSDLQFRWWRGQDLNLRPSGYEPDELPDCSTPRRTMHGTHGFVHHQVVSPRSPATPSAYPPVRRACATSNRRAAARCRPNTRRRCDPCRRSHPR